MPLKFVQCPFRNKGQNFDFQSGSMKVFCGAKLAI